jgi:predicted nucleotidyltransferase component of viral defense system
MLNLIKDIYQSKLGLYLGFKGGTMAYFFYSLDRFSIDLDFDLLNESKSQLIRDSLPEILKKYGTIIDDKEKYYTHFYLLSYEKGQRQIKIEVSKRNILSSYQISNFYGIDVKVQKIEDAFATKLLACTTRSKIAYRDFYDLYYYLKKSIIPNEKIIKKVTNKNLVDYLIKLKIVIEKKVTNQLVCQSIGELINESQKEFVKSRFKIELINRLSFFIDQIKNLEQG